MDFKRILCELECDLIKAGNSIPRTGSAWSVNQADPVLGMELPVHMKNYNPGKSIPRYGFAGGVWICPLHRKENALGNVYQTNLSSTSTVPVHFTWLILCPTIRIC